jgi:hypothetical protein
MAEPAYNPLDIFRRRAVVRGIPVGSRESFEAMVRAMEARSIYPVIGRVLAWTGLRPVLLVPQARPRPSEKWLFASPLGIRRPTPTHELVTTADPRRVSGDH